MELETEKAYKNTMMEKDIETGWEFCVLQARVIGHNGNSLVCTMTMVILERTTGDPGGGFWDTWSTDR